MSEEGGLNANMQRVRIGFTGLAFVFVLVLLAAVFTRATDEQPITANGIAEAATQGTAAGADEAVTEPLAELGVAPGNVPEADNAVTAKTVPVEDPMRPQRRR